MRYIGNFAVVDGRHTRVGDAHPSPRAPATHAENDEAPRSIADLRQIHDAHFAALRSSGRRRAKAVTKSTFILGGEPEVDPAD